MAEATFRLYMATSLDGYVADAEGGIDWLNDYETGVDYGTEAFMAEVDTLIMGRATFDQVMGFGGWPYAGKRVLSSPRGRYPTRRRAWRGRPIWRG